MCDNANVFIYVYLPFKVPIKHYYLVPNNPNNGSYFNTLTFPIQIFIIHTPKVNVMSI